VALPLPNEPAEWACQGLSAPPVRSRGAPPIVFVSAVRTAREARALLGRAACAGTVLEGEAWGARGERRAGVAGQVLEKGRGFFHQGKGAGTHVRAHAHTQTLPPPHTQCRTEKTKLLLVKGRPDLNSGHVARQLASTIEPLQSLC
jgi:hypothetical protein